MIRPEPKLLWRLEARDADGEMETFFVTGDHPWFVEGVGWVETSRLVAGQRIETADDQGLTILDIAPTDRVARTYNLTVTGPHTFLVGENGAVVHNCWRLGGHKNFLAWMNRIRIGGWSSDAITNTIRQGQRYPVRNNVNPANGASLYLEPGGTGRFVVVDNVTGDVLMVSRPNQLPPPALPGP
ncbi:MAG: polymorphic toxin-type HINT domain-containing protein [Hyphomonadaceae bacterium]